MAGLSPVASYRFCTGQPRSEHSTPGVALPVIILVALFFILLHFAIYSKKLRMKIRLVCVINWLRMGSSPSLLMIRYAYTFTTLLNNTKFWKYHVLSVNHSVSILNGKLRQMHVSVVNQKFVKMVACHSVLYFLESILSCLREKSNILIDYLFKFITKCGPFSLL